MLIGILLYPNVDLLDSGGPYEVFLTASRLAVRDGDPPPFEVETITIDGKAVTAYGGLVLQPSTSISEVGDLDVVIVPGTTDVSGPLGDPSLMAAVRELQAKARLTASVCTGAFILGSAGILEGLSWTTHWEDVDALAQSLGPETARRKVRWVDEGDVVTAGGLSSGIAMALHLVDRLAGRDLAERTARQIEYDWQPDGDSPTDWHPTSS